MLIIIIREIQWLIEGQILGYELPNSVWELSVSRPEA